VPGVQLKPVLDGLTAPLYVTHSRDGTGRLFVVEQGGRIKVLRPGASSPTVFLDITGRILSGGERGLLGLTFHPRYRENGRFFVDYTRTPDGATVVAEYRVSSSDPDVADAAETVLLTVAQPFANHNGGMIEFGPDGFLYIGLGDGGSANDPGNRAQNTQELLGKILRIDVDTPAGPGQPYSSPPTNPFFGTGLGRDEIYAWVGDVGQDAREEVDNVILGGNYGWRVFEGTQCTNLDPGLCGSGSYLPPVLDYDHSGGRCSITGGYVYRGQRGTLPRGAYLYADFCTGEVFILQNGTASILLQTGLSVSSFGEDEAGEIYVVGLGGTVHRLLNPQAPPVGLGLFTNATTYRPGDTFALDLTLVNDGPALAGDLYLGFGLPDQITLIFLTSVAPPAGTASRRDADPGTFPTLASRVPLPPGYQAARPGLLTFAVPGAQPSGRYTFFAWLSRAGSLADGRVDPGDLLGVGSVVVTFTH